MQASDRLCCAVLCCVMQCCFTPCLCLCLLTWGALVCVRNCSWGLQDAAVAHCWDLPPHTFGGAYAQFMGTRGFKADDRPAVRCVELTGFEVLCSHAVNMLIRSQAHGLAVVNCAL